MAADSIFAGSSLCVVGNLNRDLKTAPLPAGPGLFQDGETSVASISETIGGGGANSALAAAALGARTTFLGKVGRDALGERLERTMTRHGVTARLAQDSRHPTGTSLALSFENGHRHFLSCLPASEALDGADLDLSALSGHAHLLRADVWFAPSMLFGGNERLLQAARQAGLAVSVDLNWDPRWGRAGTAEIQARKTALRTLLPLVNLAHGNVRELKEFADAPDLETALKRLASWGVEGVVVHLGSDGAGYYREGRLVVEPAAPVREIIHSTGSGDVLSVCLMLLHHRTDLEVSYRLRLANQIVAEFMEGRRQLIPPLDDGM